jgi:glycolate oxidase
MIAEKIQHVVKNKIFIEKNIPDEYTHDEMHGLVSAPHILVKAISTEEISNVMKICYEYDVPVTPRGAGTGLVGGAVAIRGGVMIDTRLMNHIIELDEENLTVTVEPGVLLMDLSAYVESKKLFYPPDPGEKTATIGGNISTNAGGMRAVKYGVTGAYVKALTVVLANGDVVEFGSTTIKNSSGYNMVGLMVGSEGTLGIIAKAVLKVIPLPELVMSLLIPFSTMEKALQMVGKIIKVNILPVAIEYMTKETLKYAEEFLNKKFPDTNHDAYILLTFDANNQIQLDYEYKEIADLCLENDAMDVLIVSDDDRKKII